MTRTGAHLVFHPASEKATWAFTRALLRAAPQTALRALLGSLTLKPAREPLATMKPADRVTFTALFASMRSGAGFRNDLADCPDTTAQVAQPTLVIASRNDGAVPFAHSETLAAAIPHARLAESTADSHLIWLSPEYPEESPNRSGSSWPRPSRRPNDEGCLCGKCRGFSLRPSVLGRQRPCVAALGTARIDV